MTPRPLSSIVVLIAVASMLSGAGCSSPRPTLRPETAQALYEISLANQRSGTVKEQSFSAMDWSLGHLPSTGQTLPLNSPNGRWIATETGPVVQVATLLALPGCPIPDDSSVEIWRVDPASAKLTLHASLPAPLLLGRAADASGFLVEHPRKDGSRWIGKVDWSTGQIDWLVQDASVNAFGSLGPEGELAWCSRPINQGEFTLAIRFTDGEEIGIGPANGEWLLPSWSTRASRLSVFFLSKDGILSLMSLDARTPQLVREAPRRFDMMTGARRTDVLRARSGQPVIQGTPPPPLEEVIFYHPVVQSTYVWLPMSLRRDPPFALSPDSIVAANDPFTKGYLVGTTADLRWQDPDNRNAFVRVRYGSTIPRVTTSTIAPYLLFVPDPAGMEVRAMVPQPDTAAPAPSSDLADAPIG